MEWKKLVSIIFEVLCWLSLIALSICLTYFGRDVWNDFKSKKTNDRVYSKRAAYFNYPAIIICFEPQINETILMKYNKTFEALDYYKNPKRINLTIPVSTLKDQIHYKIGRDYSIHLALSYHGSNEYLNVAIGEKVSSTTSPEIGKMIQVEELPLIMYGTCTVLKFSKKLKGSIQMHNVIKIRFKSQDSKTLPRVNFLFASVKNIFGVIWQQWIEGKVFSISVDPKETQDQTVSLKEQIQMKLPETSYCSLEQNYFECLAQM